MDQTDTKKPVFKTEAECKAVLETAVIRRCMADVEIGLLLSGGLDSSILGALMTQPHIKKHLTGMLDVYYLGIEILRGNWGC